MSKSEKKRSLRPLLFVVAVAGVVVVLRNAVADKGGSYDPADLGAR
ncbi:hypothetical protein [Aeromicrobium sp.]|nr:hypothetical protein [Aeromicrobium sp.]MBC7631907.1 hypothetical protein [Aeromicrobium sp.]